MEMVNRFTKKFQHYASWNEIQMKIYLFFFLGLEYFICRLIKYKFQIMKIFFVASLNFWHYYPIPCQNPASCRQRTVPEKKYETKNQEFPTFTPDYNWKFNYFQCEGKPSRAYLFSVCILGESTHMQYIFISVSWVYSGCVLDCVLLFVLLFAAY